MDTHKSSIFKGAATALITPFQGGRIDYDALTHLIEFQIEEGTDALIVCGTTGEPATMTEEEKLSVIRFAVDVIDIKSGGTAESKAHSSCEGE